MNEKEAQAYRRLQNENTELRKQLESLQSEKKEARAAESTPPTKKQFDKMGYQQRVEFKGMYPEIYAEYVK